MMPLMPSPGSPNTTRTPQSMRRSTSTSAAVRDMEFSAARSCKRGATSGMADWLMAEGSQDGDRESFEDRGGGNGPASIAALRHDNVAGEHVLEWTGSRHVDACVVPHRPAERRPGGIGHERADEARHARDRDRAIVEPAAERKQAFSSRAG